MVLNRCRVWYLGYLHFVQFSLISVLKVLRNLRHFFLQMIEFYLCYGSVITFFKNLKHILFWNLLFSVLRLSVVRHFIYLLHWWFWRWNSSSFFDKLIYQLLLIIFCCKFYGILSSSINVLQIASLIKQPIEHFKSVGFYSIIQRCLSVIIDHIMFGTIGLHQLNSFKLSKINSIVNSILSICVLIIDSDTLLH